MITKNETQEMDQLNEEEKDLRFLLRYLAPWIDKTDGQQTMGDWESNLESRMLVKLLELWLTEESRKRVEKMLDFYHPLDRAAMAYALVVYMMTGTKMRFKNGAANQHFRLTIQMLKADMPELTFAGHMKYMINKYGKSKKVK